MSARHTAYLGIGGNIGDPPKTMAAALRLIDSRDDTKVAAVSRLYRTPPWGVTDQPYFYNACARVETELSPRDLLELCLSSERAFKRERRERWGPRTLDLDVLDYGGEPYEGRCADAAASANRRARLRADPARRHRAVT